MNSQMNQNQMSQLLGRMGPGSMSHQVGGMANQMGQMNPNAMPQINPNAPGNMAQGQQMGPNVINTQMPINQPNMPPQNQMGGGPGQMNLTQMLNMQQHMGRKQDMMMANSPNMYQVRNVGPQNPYFRKSPSPSAPSPANIGQPHQGQMVPSPALVPSPQMQNLMPQQRNVMVQSPSSSINTPGQANAGQSPINPHEEQQYREKYRQLTKYIEPLKRMVARIGYDGKDSSKPIL